MQPEQSEEPKRFWVETLGCPKNEVDSDRIVGRLASEGLLAAVDACDADLVVVNTCAFIEEARQESIDTVLAMSDRRAEGARLVVTGCMAQRYGDEVAVALPEVDAVVGFGVPVTLSVRPGTAALPGEDGVPSLDLLNLDRPAGSAPWAYVKIAEGCDRSCGFCAIPSFRGKQRSRTQSSILHEVEALGVREVVLVAQDLASYGRDQGEGRRQLTSLIPRVGELVDRVRLLYLYPADLTDVLVETILASGVAYFDLSLQHVSRSLLASMRRWGSGERFLERIDSIRSLEPRSVFRSNFIVGYPGETEADHEQLVEFIEEAQLDWCGFFAYSEEEGTYAATIGPKVPPGLAARRLRELGERQDQITARRRADLVGTTCEVLVDRVAEARSFREAPEIDGVIAVPDDLAPGTFLHVAITDAVGPDLEAVPVGGFAP